MAGQEAGPKRPGGVAGHEDGPRRPRGDEEEGREKGLLEEVMDQLYDRPREECSTVCIIERT